MNLIPQIKIGYQSTSLIPRQAQDGSTYYAEHIERCWLMAHGGEAATLEQARQLVELNRAAAEAFELKVLLNTDLSAIEEDNFKMKVDTFSKDSPRYTRRCITYQIFLASKATVMSMNEEEKAIKAVEYISERKDFSEILANYLNFFSCGFDAEGKTFTILEVDSGRTEEIKVDEDGTLTD